MRPVSYVALLKSFVYEWKQQWRTIANPEIKENDVAVSLTTFPFKVKCFFAVYWISSSSSQCNAPILVNHSVRGSNYLQICSAVSGHVIFLQTKTKLFHCCGWLNLPLHISDAGCGSIFSLCSTVQRQIKSSWIESWILTRRGNWVILTGLKYLLQVHIHVRDRKRIRSSYFHCQKSCFRRGSNILGHVRRTGNICLVCIITQVNSKHLQVGWRTCTFASCY